MISTQYTVFSCFSMLYACTVQDAVLPSRGVVFTGESKTRDPQDTRVEANVWAMRGMTHLRDGAERPPQTRRRHCDLAQRPRRVKTTQHADTAAPDTPNNTKHIGVSLTHSLTQVLCSHAACTRKTAQHETPMCTRCS